MWRPTSSSRDSAQVPYDANDETDRNILKELYSRFRPDIGNDDSAQAAQMFVQQQQQQQQQRQSLTIGVNATGQPDMASVDELMARSQGRERYYWFADANLDAASKILLLVGATLSAVTMWYPFGLTAAGWTYMWPVFGMVVPACLVILYAAVILLTICDKRFFNNNLRWILVSDLRPHYRIGDRWFSFFNGLVGFWWNFTFFLLWLTFYLNNPSFASKSDFLNSSGFVTQPYAGLTALGVIGYFVVCTAFAISLYANTATRENRDIMQRIVRLFKDITLEDVIVGYEQKMMTRMSQNKETV